MGYVAGIDVGGTKVAYGLFDEKRNLVERLQHPSDRELDAPAFADQMVATVRELVSRHGPRQSLEGLGICMPSFIDGDTGVLMGSVNLPNLTGFAMTEYLEQAMGIPVRMDNDCNAAALAEHRYGAGEGTRNMLYVAVSTGLGLGIIIDGRVFRGDQGWAGESGHMIADPENPRMDYENHVAGGSIVKLLAQRIRGGEESLLVELCGGDLAALSAKHIETAWHQGDRLARWALDHMAHYLGVWAYNLYMTFNINTYVFGGGLTKFGDPLLGEARRVMDRLAEGSVMSTAPVDFRVAQLGADFGIIGAAELLFQG